MFAEYTLIGWEKIDVAIVRMKEILVNASLTEDYQSVGMFGREVLITLTEIVEAGDNNTKSDMWFLAGMYLYGQAIELLCKALILPFNKSSDEITTAFKSHKHKIF